MACCLKWQRTREHYVVAEARHSVTYTTKTHAPTPHGYIINHRCTLIPCARGHRAGFPPTSILHVALPNRTLIQKPLTPSTHYRVSGHTVWVFGTLPRGGTIPSTSIPVSTQNQKLIKRHTCHQIFHFAPNPIFSQRPPAQVATGGHVNIYKGYTCTIHLANIYTLCKFIANMAGNR